MPLIDALSHVLVLEPRPLTVLVQSAPISEDRVDGRCSDVLRPLAAYELMMAVDCVSKVKAT